MRQTRNKHSARLSWLIIGLISVVCITFFAAAVIVSSKRELSELEAIFFQLMIVTTGSGISYLLSKKSATATARNMVKDHVRPAFRRVVNLYGSLSRLTIRIEELRCNPSLNANHALDIIDAIVNEQIPTGADALDDWRDILPEEVKDIERQAARRRNEHWE